MAMLNNQMVNDAGNTAIYSIINRCDTCDSKEEGDQPLMAAKGGFRLFMAHDVCVSVGSFYLPARKMHIYIYTHHHVHYNALYI